MPHLSPIPWILIPITLWIMFYLFMIVIWFSPNIHFPSFMMNSSPKMKWNWS